ncbi:MAG: beta-mannosidase [Bacillota bacterium]|nr:MAG: beta-mannosidase [Bacillota bacterium]
MRSVVLTGPWKVEPLTTAGIYTQNIPSHWQDIPELSDYSGGVVYSINFSYPSLPPGGQARLRLSGVLSASRVILNGTELGYRNGYFAPWEANITDLLQETNLLELEVECPPDVFSHLQYMEPAFNPGGVWLPVELICSGETYLRDVKLQYYDDTSLLRVNIRVDGLREGAILNLCIQPLNFAGEPKRAEFSVSQDEESFDWQIRDIELWWTHDTGYPSLYRVEATLSVQGTVNDTLSFNYGFRTVTSTEDFTFYLNGKRLFLRGSNYLPTDVRLAHCSRPTIEKDLSLARQAHLNILKVSAHVGHPLLYDVADEIGLLLWQDMPLHGLYQHKILSEARVLVREVLTLLYNHPSVAFWCMHHSPVFLPSNSNDSWWLKLRSLFSQLVFSWNRDVLDAELKRVAESADPSRPVIRSSGEFALLHSPTDTHLYFGWNKSSGKKRNFEVLKGWIFRKNLSFVSEFGAQSFPNYENSKLMLGSDWETLKKQCATQLDLMRHWMPVYEATDLPDLVELTQMYQSELIQYYIDHLRFMKYKPTKGIMSYALNDPTPAVSFSVIDFWREPKASYYALQRAMSPQYVFTLIPKDTYRVGEVLKLPIYAINDAWEGFPAAGAVATLLDPTGTVVTSDRYALSLPVDCEAQSVGIFLAEPSNSGLHILKLDLVMPDRVVTNSYKIRVLK